MKSIWKNFVPFLLINLFVICTCFNVEAGSIFGTVLKTETGESVAFASVELTQEGATVIKSNCDYNGKFYIDKIANGTYGLKVTYKGFYPKYLKSLVIEEEIKEIAIKVESGTSKCELWYVIKLIEEVTSRGCPMRAVRSDPFGIVYKARESRVLSEENKANWASRKTNKKILKRGWSMSLYKQTKLFYI
ncbi:MAG: carboxypeptidase-like regulatory domain-containing protein [Flavobacteriales bacterium]|nr:carboxypeptidase-like regulatory domain-containing protein [Flavobacteriales bacterium]